MRDMQAEFGVSFNYLRAWRGKEAALTSLRGDDAESYKSNSTDWSYNFYIYNMILSSV